MLAYYHTQKSARGFVNLEFNLLINYIEPSFLLDSYAEMV
jgi:hypothetical protein